MAKTQIEIDDAILERSLSFKMTIRQALQIAVICMDFKSEQNQCEAVYGNIIERLQALPPKTLERFSAFTDELFEQIGLVVLLEDIQSAKCLGCGQTYAEHETDRPEGSPVPRMPCLGLKGGFISNALAHADSRSEVVSKPDAAITVERFNLTDEEKAELSINTRLSDIPLVDSREVQERLDHVCQHFGVEFLENGDMQYKPSYVTKLNKAYLADSREQEVRRSIARDLQGLYNTRTLGSETGYSTVHKIIKNLQSPSTGGGTKI